MIPVYEDAFFAFRFADVRLVPRFHLDGVAPGQRVVVSRPDPEGERIAEATVGEGGWVDLPTPVIVGPGNGFVVRVL